MIYLDGFDRPLQEIQVHASPDGYSDLVIPYQYGTMGMEEKSYLLMRRHEQWFI